MLPSRHGHRARAWIEGKSCTLQEAIAAAAAHLWSSRQTVFAGLGCDISGVRAVVRLARKTKGVIDYLGQEHCRCLDVLRDAGMFLTTPAEAIARADTVIVVQGARSSIDQSLLNRIVEAPPKLAGSRRLRRVLWLGRGARRARAGSGVEIKQISLHPLRIGSGLATLRAHFAGRCVGAAPIQHRDVHSILETLRATSFGVAIWSLADLDQVSIEMLGGLVRDLNFTTRFSSLAATAATDLTAAAMAMTWLTGFPSNVGFATGAAVYDPWRFNAARLAQSGEIDLAVWISGVGDDWPIWSSKVPVIALTSQAAPERKLASKISIDIGRPGIDHDAIASSAATGGLALLTATKPSSLPSLADVVGAMELALDKPARARR